MEEEEEEGEEGGQEGGVEGGVQGGVVGGVVGGVLGGQLGGFNAVHWSDVKIKRQIPPSFHKQPSDLILPKNVVWFDFYR